MRGFPKHIATKEDLECVEQLFPKEATAYKKRLMENRFVWQDAGIVAKGEVVTPTDTLKVVTTQTETGITEQRKQVLVEDTSAQFFRLGLKVEDVAKEIDEVK
jgi:hypothetical protein